MTDCVERLRAIAKEISDEGHTGWPNELNWIADALASERAKQAEPDHKEWCSLRRPEYCGECDCDAAPPAVQAEPVAWAETDGQGTLIWGANSFGSDPHDFAHPIPLYAAPPADEAVRLLRDVTDHWLESGPMKIAIDRYLARVTK